MHFNLNKIIFISFLYALSLEIVFIQNLYKCIYACVLYISFLIDICLSLFYLNEYVGLHVKHNSPFCNCSLLIYIIIIGQLCSVPSRCNGATLSFGTVIFHEMNRL